MYHFLFGYRIDLVGFLSLDSMHACKGAKSWNDATTFAKDKGGKSQTWSFTIAKFDGWMYVSTHHGQLGLFEFFLVMDEEHASVFPLYGTLELQALIDLVVDDVMISQDERAGGSDILPKGSKSIDGSILYTVKQIAEKYDLLWL